MSTGLRPSRAILPRLLYGLLLETPLGPRLNPAGWINPRPDCAEPSVSFLIPLISKAMAQDWARVSQNLARCLQSLRNQTDPNWRVIICGQDRPEGLVADERILFLPFPSQVVKYDKPAKLRRAIRALPAAGHVDGYVMPLDGDDVAHPDLVGYVRSDNNGHGYLIASGIMADLEHRRLWHMRPPSADEPNNVPFWGHCGSCTMVRCDLSRGLAGLTPLLCLKDHDSYHTVAARFGLHVQDIPFEAMVYVVLHGENMQRKRGKDKGLYLPETPVSEASWQAFCTEFALG